MDFPASGSLMAEDIAFQDFNADSKFIFARLPSCFIEVSVFPEAADHISITGPQKSVAAFNQFSGSGIGSKDSFSFSFMVHLS
ncbi:MAG: hypothetical protein PVG81_07195 [Desulfobacterales bacterium]